MNSEPSDEAVNYLIEMGISVDRNDAAKKLRAHGNDAHRAIEAFFESPGATSGAQNAQNEWDSSQWDENQFHTDRSNYQDQNVPSFSIHSPDDPADNLRPNVFGAPSRPPSRVNEREPIDLTDAHAAADPSKSLSAEDRENEDLRRAMELSMSDIGPQESGVTNASGTHFGPANREHYDSSKWAMTTTHAAAHEIVLDPEPADRQRENGEPASLKPSAAGPFLNSLLVILHSIPLAREALLSREHLLSDYGHDDEWWKGTAIKVPRIVDMGTNGSAALETRDEILYETQRVLAFLDGTDRSYASVEVLVNEASEQDQNVEMVASDYLTAWRQVAQIKNPPPRLCNVFQSTGLKVSSSTGEVIGRSLNSAIGLQLDDRFLGSDLSLYEAIDDLIWEGNAINEDSDTYLEDLADLFTIAVTTLNGNRPRRGIHIPAVWYPDRYLEPSKHLAREMRAQKAMVNEKIETMTRMESNLTSYQTSNGGNGVDPRHLLQTAIAHFENGKGSGDRPNDEMASSPAAPNRTGEFTDKGSDIVERLKATCESVTEKLDFLQEQKEKARESLREISALLTRPTENPQLGPRHPYTLRGISTDQHITYVLYPMASESSHAPVAGPREYQWWRITYSASDTKPVCKMKVDEDLVLQAAMEEGKTAILVYASERATDERFNQPLPAALENFVRADNLAFAAELSGTTSQAAPPTEKPAPLDQAARMRQSPKRKASSSSSSQSSQPWGAQSPTRMPPGGAPGPVERDTTAEAEHQGGREMTERGQGSLVAAAMGRGGGQSFKDSAMEDVSD